MPSHKFLVNKLSLDFYNDNFASVDKGGFFSLWSLQEGRCQTFPILQFRVYLNKYY